MTLPIPISVSKALRKHEGTIREQFLIKNLKNIENVKKKKKERDRGYKIYSISHCTKIRLLSNPKEKSK